MCDCSICSLQKIQHFYLDNANETFLIINMDVENKQRVGKIVTTKTSKGSIRPISKPKLGRPLQTFTKAQINKIGGLAFKGCQNTTISHIIGCDKNTLKKYLSQLLTKKRAERKAWLREVQAKRAEKDASSAMVIFLGKNELGQADKQEHVLSGEIQLLPPKIA